MLDQLSKAYSKTIKKGDSKQTQQYEQSRVRVLQTLLISYYESQVSKNKLFELRQSEKIKNQIKRQNECDQEVVNAINLIGTNVDLHFWNALLMYPWDGGWGK